MKNKNSVADMPPLIRVLLILSLAPSVFGAEILHQKKFNTTWRIGSEEFEISIGIPENWKIDDDIAYDTAGTKRIEISTNGKFSSRLITGKKIIYRQSLRPDVTVLLSEEQNSAETGNKMVSGKLFACYIVLRNSEYQEIHFFDWHNRPSNRELFMTMVKHVVISKLRRKI